MLLASLSSICMLLHQSCPSLLTARSRDQADDAAATRHTENPVSEADGVQRGAAVVAETVEGRYLVGNRDLRKRRRSVTVAADVDWRPSNLVMFLRRS